MKGKTAAAIMKAFAEWSNTCKELKPACRSGCDTCCTRNITVTALEGEAILRYVQENDLTAEFALTLGKTLSEQPAISGPASTANEFADACLGERDVPDDPEPSSAPCPFLQDNLCTLYPVRPFACRMFISSVVCNGKQPAIVPDFYFEAATCTIQLLEHLDQKEYWGNLYDVLGALAELREFRRIGEIINEQYPGEIRKAQMRVRAGKPLPGFLISEENNEKVQGMLDFIFNTTVEGRRIEDVLNGK